MPKPYRLACKVNLIGDIVPYTGFPCHIPLADATNIPTQVEIAGACFPIDQAIFHLRKVAFKEAHLVLVNRAGRIGVTAHHAKVVIYHS